MQSLIVYFDDVVHATKQVLPMFSDKVPTRVVLVACPPSLPHHVTKWVSKEDLESWRLQWAKERTAPLVQTLQGLGQQVVLQVAKSPLTAVTTQLQAQWGSGRILDARRPKWMIDDEPVTPDQPVSRRGQWAIPGSLVALGALAAIAAD